MGFQKISSLSLTDLFVQQIENMILSGELAVGEQLPPARELSIRMGVSRPVISAGVIELEKLGFVEIIPRQGVYVSDYRRKGTVETLNAIMRYNQGMMRKSEVKSLLEVRESLECLRIDRAPGVCRCADSKPTLYHQRKDSPSARRQCSGYARCHIYPGQRFLHKWPASDSSLPPSSDFEAWRALLLIRSSNCLRALRPLRSHGYKMASL